MTSPGLCSASPSPTHHTSPSHLAWEVGSGGGRSEERSGGESAGSSDFHSTDLSELRGSEGEESGGEGGGEGGLSTCSPQPAPFPHLPTSSTTTYSSSRPLSSLQVCYGSQTTKLVRFINLL